MNGFAWKNRVTLSLGIGIATVALIAGCSGDDDEGDGIDTGTGTEITQTTEPTETMTATEGATETMTETATASATGTATETGSGTAEDVTLTISADGVMMDGTMADTVTLAAGSTVTFENDGENAVNVTTDDGAIDEEIAAGDSYDYTFDEAGTWTVSVDGEEMVTITVS
ncbi:MAG: hypothetical protein H6674_05765 [Dehalococcoidia bacterium]|nr:hypothetical protein [Dehalococcoidia bacterium]